MNLYPSHTAKVFLVILSLALSSLIFGISAADYYSYPLSSAAVRKINSTDGAAALEEYKSKAKDLFATLSRIAKENRSDTENIDDLKAKLMSLVVPKEFMNLHVGLVLATDKLIDYSKSKDDKKLQQASNIITQAKKQYDWLN
jgi:hypothetical protein